MANTLDRRSLLVGAAAVALSGAALRPALSQSAADASASSLSSILIEPESAEDLSIRIAQRVKAKAAALRQRHRRWAKLFPEAAEQSKTNAEYALAGNLRFQGTGGERIFVGNPPKWTENPAGTDDYVVTLNRMQHWAPLLAMWIVTEDDQYASKVASELDSWITDCPPPPIDLTGDLGEWRTIRPWRMLEIGFRMRELWPNALILLAGTEFMPPELLARMVQTMHYHGRALAELSGPIRPEATGNWYTYQMAGLLAVSAALPELKAAEEWKAYGWQELERNAKVSMLESGGQEEGAPHYSNLCMNLFSEGIRIGRTSGLRPSEDFASRMTAAAQYALFSCRPNGKNVPWADSDSGSTAADAIVAATDSIDAWDTAAVYKTLVGAEKLEDAAATMFLKIDEPEPWFEKIEMLAPASADLAFWAKDLDQAMARTDWTSKASSLFFACRTPTPYGHAHQDPAGFDYCALGRPILVDPGRYIYEDGEERRRFKSATFHNTVTVNDKEPFAYLGSFELGPQKEGRIVGHYSDAQFEAFEALNRNYEPAVHRRLVTLFPDGGLLVVDHLDGLASADKVQIWFHFDSTAVEWDAATGTARTIDTDVPNIALAASAGLSGELLPGFVSEVIDNRHDSTRLRLENTGNQQTRTMASYVLPSASEAAEVSVAVTAGEGGVLTIELGGAKTHRLRWTLGQTLTSG